MAYVKFTICLANGSSRATSRPSRICRKYNASTDVVDLLVLIAVRLFADDPAEERTQQS
jgi:hypothetical protein